MVKEGKKEVKVRVINEARIKLDTAGDTFSRRIIFNLTLYIHKYIYIHMDILICIHRVGH